MLFRAALRERLATAVPDFWANQHIFMKIEGERAKLIAHGKGELGVLNFRQILPDNLTPTTALDLLTSKGYTLKKEMWILPRKVWLIFMKKTCGI